MTTSTTPPAAWDRHALEVARGIASIDRSKLPGLTTQFVAILQEAIVESMKMAAEPAPVTDAHTAKAMVELADCRAMVRDLREQQCASYPRAVVEQLLTAIDALVTIAEAAVRDVAPCAESQTGVEA